MHLFMQPFSHTSMNSYIFILYFGLESNTVLFILCSNCSSFDHWELFRIHPCAPLTYHLLFLGSSSLLFFSVRYSRLILYFPVLESAISPGTLGSFHRRMNDIEKTSLAGGDKLFLLVFKLSPGPH